MNKHNDIAPTEAKDLDRDGWASTETARLEELAARVIGELKSRGASAAEVAGSVSQGLSTTVRMGTVETLEYSRDRGFGITAYFGQRKGTASSADLSPESIAKSIDMVCDIARFTEADDCAGLAEQELMATHFPDLDLWHPWQIEAEQAIELATAMEAAALEFDPLISNSEGAAVSAGDGVSTYANSHGFSGSRQSSRHSLSCAVVAHDPAQTDKNMQRDYWYDTGRVAGSLMEPVAIGRKAAERAVGRFDPRGLATTKAPALFVPEMARSLFGHLVSAISGGSLYRKSSFLLDQLGEKLFPEFITLRELPFEPRGLRSRAFDNEGVATSERSIVDQGVLAGYLLSSYSGRKLKLPTTGNAGGTHNLTLFGGHGEQGALISGMTNGLIVTELMGQGVNIVSGDYSRGASGYWVENGEIAFPVEGVTVAGNLRDIFRNIEAVAADTDYRGGLRCGSLLVGQMTIAGNA